MKLLLRLIIASLVAMPLIASAQGRSAELSALIDELVAANHILAAQGILPGYGHVSVRHPTNPNHYFMSRSLAPELVTVDDIVEYDLDSQAIQPTGRTGYLERFIHGEIYRARADVMAVVHNHSPAVISFGIGTTPLRPVFHQAAFFLDGIPIWDYRDFGTADGALVNTPARGRAMAVALGDRPVVMMRNHGVAIVGASLPMVVGRSITLEENAEMQNSALARGDEITYLEFEKETPGSDFLRAWDLWKQQLQDARP